jgi:hypothetical protein
MPVQGLVRLRKHQFGRQLVPGTNVAATRAYPHSGVPEHELNWTDLEIDAGSRDITAPPYREAPDLTASLEYPVVYYNNLPKLFSGFFGGDVAPTTSGTSFGWEWVPASATLDDPDLYTYEFGDDVLTDWFQDGDGILESFEIAGPVGLGPLTATEGWRFGSVKSTGSTDSPVTGSVPTPGLSVSVDDIICYLKDGAIYIGDTPYSIESNQISDALYSFTLTGEQEIDQKRWANGDQSFDTDAMVPGARTIELECRFAKTADIVGVGSESDDWMSDQPVNRYVRMEFTSTSEASTGIFYSFAFEGPMRYYTRTEDEEGGNTVVTLMGRFFYDPNDFGGIFRATVVNTLSEAELGEAGS